jgi:hypothetical protein
MHRQTFRCTGDRSAVPRPLARASHHGAELRQVPGRASHRSRRHRPAARTIIEPCPASFSPPPPHLELHQAHKRSIASTIDPPSPRRAPGLDAFALRSAKTPPEGTGCSELFPPPLNCGRFFGGSPPPNSRRFSGAVRSAKAVAARGEGFELSPPSANPRGGFGDAWSPGDGSAGVRHPATRRGAKGKSRRIRHAYTRARTRARDGSSVKTPSHPFVSWFVHVWRSGRAWWTGEG